VGDVVVGVDGSPGARAAFRFAVEEARLREGRVVAILAWQLPIVEEPAPYMVGTPTFDVPVGETAGAYRNAAFDLIDSVLAELADGAAGVQVERRVVEDSPAAALLEASKTAELLVVGARGHGRIASLLLGSVSLQCVQHARCPVIVVRYPADSAPDTR